MLSRATRGSATCAGRVTQVLARGRRALDGRGRRSGRGRRATQRRALVLTGPGVHRAFPHEPEVASRVFHCDSKRERVRDPLPGRAACDDRDRRRRRERAELPGVPARLSAALPGCTVYTPMLPMSRGESFLENRVFADPDGSGGVPSASDATGLFVQALRPWRLRRRRAWRQSPTTTTVASSPVASPTWRRWATQWRRGGVRLRRRSHERRRARARLRRQLHRLRPARAVAQPVRAGDEGRDRVPVGPMWERPAEPRCRWAAASNCAACARGCTSRDSPRWSGAGLRQPRCPGPAGQPDAAAAARRAKAVVCHRSRIYKYLTEFYPSNVS